MTSTFIFRPGFPPSKKCIMHLAFFVYAIGSLLLLKLETWKPKMIHVPLPYVFNSLPQAHFLPCSSSQFMVFTCIMYTSLCLAPQTWFDIFPHLLKKEDSTHIPWWQTFKSSTHIPWWQPCKTQPSLSKSQLANTKVRWWLSGRMN